MNARHTLKWLEKYSIFHRQWFSNGDMSIALGVGEERKNTCFAPLAFSFKGPPIGNEQDFAFGISYEKSLCILAWVSPPGNAVVFMGNSRYNENNDIHPEGEHATNIANDVCDFLDRYISFHPGENDRRRFIRMNDTFKFHDTLCEMAFIEKIRKEYE